MTAGRARAAARPACSTCASASTSAAPTPMPSCSIVTTGLLAKAKRPTSADVSSGIEAAVDAVLAGGEVERSRISHVMLGTTHATNAVLERRKLHRVAILRIGAPATLSVRPLLTWPEDLKAAVSGGEAMVRGGIELDGRDIVPFDADAVRELPGALARARSTRSPSPASSPRSRPATSWPPPTSRARSWVATSISRSATSWGRWASSSARTRPSSTARCWAWPATWRARWPQRWNDAASTQPCSSPRTTARSWPSSTRCASRS